ncbi:MAG: hypothetical protein KGV43_03850 [Arcobacter sp.]|nr:hypothetical protein [Arcobacter sp.]
MVSFEFVLVGLVVLFVCILFYIFKKERYFSKPSYVKKSELIEDYKKQMRKIIEENKDNPDKKMQERLKFLKIVNQELAMNLFFDENEAKELINELAQM